MTKERSSSVRRPIDTSLSNSFSSGASSHSTTAYGVKTIRVFKNGDPYHQGSKFLVNRRYIRDLEHLLSVISEKLDLPYGAKRLYTPNGKLIRDFSEIEDKQDYVASSGHFTPQKYGMSTNPIGFPFRSTSPHNMPSTRASRSQTRLDTSKSTPTLKKRSLSGLTKASINSEKKIETWKGANATKPLIPKQSGALQTEVKKKKKVVKKKKKPEEIVIPQAKPSNGEKKQNKKEEEKKEAKKEEEKKKETPEEKREEPKKGAEVVVPEKNGRQETAERSPSPRKEEHEENNNKTESSEDERERSHTPSSSERSGTASGEHSERDEHSDGNEQDEEKSPLPPRKSSPAPKEEAHPEKKDNGATAAVSGGSEKVKRKKPTTKTTSSTNWGDLSSFTKNIESLLKK